MEWPWFILLTIYFYFKVCADNNSFQEKNVKTTSEPKHSNVFGIEEVLKTDNTENGSTNTKEDDSENPKKKLKDILNTNKEIQILKQNRQEKTERYFKYRKRNLWINFKELGD